MIDFIHHIEEITPRWVGSVFAEAGHDVAVAAVRTEPVGTGQMSQSIRVEPRLEGGPIDGVPDSVVIKIPGLSEAARAGGAAGAYPSEVRFYAEVASTVAIDVPRCHLALLGADGADFVLVLEDLAPARQGDQIAGCGSAQASAAVRALGGLAGPRWGDPTLSDIEGIDHPDEEGTGFWAAVFGDAVTTFLDRYSGRIAADDADVLTASAARMQRWMLGRPDRFSLIHGDFRLDNLLFTPGSPEQVTTVDWQTLNIGLPARDLAYFCGTSLSVEDRRAHEGELVEIYHAALLDHGVDDYSLDTCRDDYRFGHLQGPLITVLGAAYADPTERGDAMFTTMIRRSCQAIVDLGTLDLIDREGPGGPEPVA